MSKRDLCVRRFHGGTALLVVTSYSPEFVSIQRYGVRRLAAALLLPACRGAAHAPPLFGPCTSSLRVGASTPRENRARHASPYESESKLSHSQFFFAPGQRRAVPDPYCIYTRQRKVSVLEGELVAGQFEAVEIAHDAGSQALGLKEFLRDLLNVFTRDFFEQCNQFHRRKIAVEVEVVSRQAVHPLAGAFGRKQRRTFQMILCAAQLLFRNWLVLDPAEFLEPRTHNPYRHPQA